MLRREGVHDPPLLEPGHAADRERDRGPPRGLDRDLSRERPRLRPGRAGRALLPRRPAGGSDVGRLRRIARRPGLSPADRSRAPARIDAGKGPSVIPFTKYPGLSPLFHDFLAGLPEFFPDPPTLDAAADRGRELLAAGARARVPASAFRHRGEKAARMAEDLAAGRAVAISAGHQVGLFTGPAFTLMKALDAIRIAERALAPRCAGRAGLLGADRRPRSPGDRPHGASHARRTAGARARGRGPTEPPARRPSADPRARPRNRRRLPRGLRARARRRRPDPRSLRRAQRSGRSLRGSLHRDAPRSGRARAASRDRAPRRRRSGRRPSRSFSKPREKADALSAVLRDTVARLERAGKPVPAPLPEGFSFFLIDAEGRRRVTDLAVRRSSA